MTRLAKIRLISILFIFISVCLNAEVIKDNDFKFSLDIPEGFQIDSYSQDGMSYMFSHPNIPVNLVMKLYDGQLSSNSKKVLSDTLNKLSAKFEADTFAWEGENCSISSFTMQIDKKYKGWALACPCQIDGAYITLLCYAPEDKEVACEQFIMSTLNSLCINEKFYYEPGIITTYAFPSEGKKNISTSINGQTFTSTIDKVDFEASDFVIDLEYAVLTLYANHKMWKEAWQRYYRMIYRDSRGRLQDFSSKALVKLYPVAKKENPENPALAYAQYLLSWVQTFDYQRNTEKNSSDFTSIVSTICGQGNDCDSRSMLLAIMLGSAGIESIMLISRDYSHALAGILLDAPGQKYKLEATGDEYLFGETTAKVTWGMIAKDHSDRTKWIPVTFNP